MRVGIIGQGVIGKAQGRLFSNHDLVTYDPQVDDEYPYDELTDCDFAVVCVGTPQGEAGEADLTALTAAARALPLDLPVMVRSTVPPGTTDQLFTGLRCHVPEFMGENKVHPWQDATDVPYLLLGGDGPSRSFFRPRIEKVFWGEIHECAAIESEMAKYTTNLYWAMRVTFVNEIAKVCSHLDVDYEQVRRAWLQDPRMTDAYTRRDGFPAGFGGRCWPKDLAALSHAADEAGYAAEFLDAIEDANGRFRA
jgi:UDPglucose 6-dehydrogenase